MKNTLSVLSLFLLFLSAQQAHTHMPQAPSDLTATSVDNGIRLSWTAPPNPGEIAGYTIYRCEEGETPCTPTLIKWVAHPGDTPPPPTSYTDGGVAVVDGVMIGLVAGTTYRYQVTASYTMDYHESFRSNAVTVLAEGGADPAPEPEPESSMYPPAPPTGLTATPGVDSIDLSWNAPSDDIAGYSIYRCEEGETPCQPEWIAWVANEGDVPPAPTSYTDGGAAVVDGVMVGLVAGTTYRYAVTSNNVDSAGDYYESDDRSEEVTALAAGDTEPEPEPEPKPEPEPEPEPEPAKPAVTPEEKQAALEDVSATMGRNMLSGIVTTIGNRFTAAPDASKFSLAGRQMTLDDLAARGRVLVLHSEDDDYEEQGFSLSAGLQPYRDGTGLSLSVAPRWGGSAAGTAAMLSPEGSGLYSRSIAAQRRRGSLHTALSYGFAKPETGGVTTPFAEFDVTDGAGYRARLGTRYQLSAAGNTLKLELSSDLTTMPTHAAAAADDSPAHEVWLTAALQGRPFTSSDGRRRRAGRILAQADSVDSTTTNPQPDEAAEDTVEIEEIRVIGSRFQRSLSDALDEKRRADEIIEALSAEDIGALPDTSVAESLAKLPGVSYTRNAFGANNLSIRGLGAVLTNGTLNGRDLASEWGDRSVSFNMFPAELIARASLYKAPAASHVEGGIGGTLNLRTARALEWGERYVVANVRGRYNDLAGDLPDSEEFGYRGSVAYLDQFANDTVGIAIGYAGQYAPLVGADSQIYESRTVGFGGAIDGIPAGVGATNDFNIPYGAEYSFFSGASERHSVLGAIQWQPVENFEINIDAFFSAFEQSNSGAGLRLAGGLGSFGNRWSNVQTDGFNVAGATVACLHDEQPNNCADRGWGQDLGAFNARDDGDSTLHSYGIEGQWSAGALTLVYDFSWSKAEGEDAYTTVGYRPYNGMPDALELVRPVATFGENDAGAAFLTSPLDFTDLATNRIDALRLIENEREDEIFTYKFDAEYAVDYPFLTAFKAGIRLVNRDNLLVRRDARLDPSPATIAAAVAINPDFVFGVYDQSQAASAFDANPVLVLDTRAVQNTVFAGIEGEEQASGGHFIEEDIKAYYLQADFETQTVFGIPASGNFGVRVVTTDVDTQGTTNVDDVLMPVSTSDKYTEVLPSANINFFPTDDIVVRLAGARVLARPAITFLSPGTDKYGDEIYSGANGGGNPLLRPYIANQFDLSVERYFDEDTALALAFFYKDMDTFITQARVVSGPPDERVTSFIAANGAGGHILGVEATAQHTFTGLLPEGYGDIGIYATYTWTDSNVELSETFNSGTFGLDGQSEHLGNLTLHYHRHKLGARISYRYRSEFTRPQRPARAFTINRAEGDLSFQVSYDMNTQLRLFVEGWNLLDEPRDNYHGLKSLQGQYTQFGRNIQLGVSYRF